MKPNKTEDKKDGVKNRNLFLLLFFSLFTIAVALIIYFFLLKDDGTIGQSRVEGISDEVYEQLIEFYFFTTTSMDRYLAEGSYDLEWIENHELYPRAEAYAKEHGLPDAMYVFPNPLFDTYPKNPATYSEIEQNYITKMINFHQSFQRNEVKMYEDFEVQLKEELNIKDSDNPFQ